MQNTSQSLRALVAIIPKHINSEIKISFLIFVISILDLENIFLYTHFFIKIINKKQIKMNIKHIFLGFALILNLHTNAKIKLDSVEDSGAMRNVMKKCQLQGSILLHTMQKNKKI